MTQIYPGFTGDYLSEKVKYSRIKRIFEEQSVAIYLIEYFGNYEML